MTTQPKVSEQDERKAKSIAKLLVPGPIKIHQLSDAIGEALAQAREEGYQAGHRDGLNDARKV